MPWYIYNASATDVSNPNNYGPPQGTPTPCPSPKNHFCSVQAVDNMGQPILTLPLIIEIANAVNNRAESTNVRLRPTP